MTNQNDFVIDNGTGFAVRQDIQDALQALAGNSSGNSEPSVKYAYQWWADTNANVLKIRNSANNAWIELFQLDGTFTLEDGSASSPGLSFRDNLNTGIFSGSANEFNISTAGTERFVINSIGNCGIGTQAPTQRLHVQSAADCIIRVTSADGNAAFLDLGDVSDPDGGRIHYDSGSNLVFNSSSLERMRIDSSGRLLVGLSSARTYEQPEPFGGNDTIPALQLEGSGSSHGDHRVFGHTYNNNDVYAPVHILAKTRGFPVTIVSNNDPLGIISFQGADGADLEEAVQIRAEVDGAPSGNDMPGRLLFCTTPSGTHSPSERMRINNSGKIFIRTNSGGDTATGLRTKVGVATDANYTDFVHSCYEAQVTINSGGQSKRIGILNAWDGNIHGTSIAMVYDGGYNMVFATNSDTNDRPVERMRVKKDGNVLIGTASNVQNTKLEVRSDSSSAASLAIANTNSSYTGTIMLLHAERETTNNSYEFLNCRIESPNPGVAAFRLEVGDDGDVRNVNNSYGQISDISLKENIVDANSQWDDFKNLKFRSYNFKESTGFPTFKQIGLVAQEAETVCPNLVKTGKEDSNTKETYKFLKTSILYMKGMKALQEAIAKIEVLETKVAALEAA